MRVKKPLTKSKTKNHSAADLHVTSKRKASAEAKPAARVMDCRSSDDRRQNDRRQKDLPVAVENRSCERRAKVSRRRQIDPTTCERDYSPAEVEFMSALDDYKRRSGRMFPTCSEILEVILGLGYAKATSIPENAEAPAIAPLAETASVATTGSLVF